MTTYARFSAVVASLVSEAVGDERNIESYFTQSSSITAFWTLIELVGSTNFLVVNGSESAYVKAETLIKTARRVERRYETLEVLKELGDAVLLRSQDFRHTLEAVLLLDAVGHTLQAQGARRG